MGAGSLSPLAVRKWESRGRCSRRFADTQSMHRSRSSLQSTTALRRCWRLANFPSCATAAAYFGSMTLSRRRSGNDHATLEQWHERFVQCVVVGTYGGKGSTWLRVLHAETSGRSRARFAAAPARFTSVRRARRRLNLSVRRVYPMMHLPQSSATDSRHSWLPAPNWQRSSPPGATSRKTLNAQRALRWSTRPSTGLGLVERTPFLRRRSRNSGAITCQPEHGRRAVASRLGWSGPCSGCRKYRPNRTSRFVSRI